MSYCRFGNLSDVYIYAGEGGIHCCCCRLTDKVDGMHDDVSFTSRLQVLSHIKSHQDAGHKILKDAVKRLRQEIKKIGDDCG